MVSGTNTLDFGQQMFSREPSKGLRFKRPFTFKRTLFKKILYQFFPCWRIMSQKDLFFTTTVNCCLKNLSFFQFIHLFCCEIFYTWVLLYSKFDDVVATNIVWSQEKCFIFLPFYERNFLCCSRTIKSSVLFSYDKKIFLTSHPARILLKGTTVSIHCKEFA